MRRSRSQPRAFTLLELVMVLMIISLVLAIAAPNLRGFWSARQHEGAARELLALTQLARTKAITDATIYRIVMDRVDGVWRFQLMVMNEVGDIVEVADQNGVPWVMPENTSVEMERADKSGLDYIDFYPSGRLDPALFRFTTRGEPEIQVVSESPTEPFRIISEAEDRIR